MQSFKQNIFQIPAVEGLGDSQIRAVQGLEDSQIPVFKGIGDSNIRNIKSFIKSACYDLNIDIELDWKCCLGGMTTLNMNKQLDEVINSEVTIVFFLAGRE